MTIFDLLVHPLTLLRETVGDVAEDRGLRWLAWATDMMMLSIAMPLTIGGVARVFSFRKDKDDAPRKQKADYVAESSERAFAFRRETVSRNPLVLPSPEPEPYVYPE